MKIQVESFSRGVILINFKKNINDFGLYILCIYQYVWFFSTEMMPVKQLQTSAAWVNHH